MLHSTLDLIANTPLLHLNKLNESRNGKIYGKLEFLQPGGSVKDRAAFQIIKDAYKSGSLTSGQTVVEMTSGNMGAGLALVCRQFGNPFVAVMPEGNSPERLKILRAFGAEIVLTEQVDGEPGKVTGKDIAHASQIAKDIAKKRNGFYVDQFNNISGINAHFETTGPEIWNELPNVDVFIASIGTGGTFTGTSKFLKSKHKNIRCIAVEPQNAAIIKTGYVSNPRHIVQGTGYGIVPPHWDKSLADDIITITDEEVERMTKTISREQGLYVGYSSGANVAAAIKYLEQTNQDVNIVTILCDSGYKYSDL